MPELRVGDEMPATTLIGKDGPVDLRARIGKPLVVYFYPKDQTYGCTIEACGFRDAYEDFTAAGAEVIGVSRDDAASHDAFIGKHRLPFTLLSDPGGKVAKSWGLFATLGIPPRVTFVFDKAGVIRHKFDSKIRFGKHVDEALEVVKKLPR